MTVAEALPRWDLSDLYTSMEAPEIEADLATATVAATAFEAAHKGRLGELDAAGLAAAIAEYERIEEILGRLGSFAGLVFAGDSTDSVRGRFTQGISERITTVGTHLLFFSLELNALDEAHVEALLAGEGPLARWRPFLRDLRVFRPHQLPAEIERVLHEKEVTGRTAWSRLFDETMAGLRVKVGEERLTVNAALDLLSNRDRAKREEAAHAIAQTFGENIKLFSLITNTLAKDKSITDGWRHYPRPGSSRNRHNMVEDDVVDALVAAVSANFGRISHRYYALKASWLGLDKLQTWDRNAPLPDDGDRVVPWEEARTRVLDAYHDFDPTIGAVGQRFFDNAWIDAAPTPGKSGGAFAHPTVPSVHPYLLVNYHGRARDVMTLAHERGHGVHQILASEQGYLMSGTPLTLAETASVFG